MIGKAYNPAWAHHEAMRDHATRWHKAKLLTAEQLAAIEQAYPLDYYRPNIFVRITLFIFTVLGCITATGTVAIGLGLQEVAVILVPLLCAGGGLFMLESFIRSSRLYRSGTDMALLYAILCWLTSIWAYVLSEHILPHVDLLLPTSPYLPLLLLPVLALLLLAVVRYADRLVAVVAYAVSLLLLANLLLQSSWGIILTPFALMLFSVAVYQLGQRLTLRSDYLYYKSCLDALKVATLATFYLGGNYFIVREGNAALSNELVSSQIPLAFLFYFFTVATPALYLYGGLRWHDRIWLLTGLLTLTLSGYTLRYYHSLLPPEVAATLLGLLLIVVAGFGLRYLRTTRHGLTATPADGPVPHLNLEALLTAETSVQHLHSPAPGFEFGGGQSGGGGADGQF